MEIDRPAVSLVMPFWGSSFDASAALDALSGLRLSDGDELIVADNTVDGVFAQVVAHRGGIDVQVVPATVERSAYYARNVAAERARTEWLLFVDADCLLPPALLDAHLAPPPGERVGAQAGRIVPAAGQQSVMARWAGSRDVLSQEQSLALPGGRAAATANLLVRRAAWAEVGGFHEGSSLGAEFEFCWRLADAGWEVAWRPQACVEHLHRESLRAVIRQFAMYAAGDAWLNRRRPGSVPRKRVGRSLARAVVAAPAFVLSGQLDRARMKVIDAVVVLAQGVGYLGGNAAPRAPSELGPSAAPPAPGIVIATDYFPVLTEQFVTREITALAAVGRRVRVEAVSRPERPLEGGARELEVNWLEDEGTIERAVAMARLALRHPLRCAADLVTRRRLDPDERMPLRALAPAAGRLERRGEVHVHVHFAALAAASWLRIGRIAGAPVSITPHAHEIYAEPRGIVEKLRSASFVTTVCSYNVERLRELVPSPERGRIHNVPIGVDTESIRRSRPPANGRTVLAVGRLVAQKGFRHLIEAAALLEREEALDELVIVGGGPLHGELARLAAELGVGGRVALTGPLDPGSVQAKMQRADLLAMPAVVAPDGNRDAVPVVVLEALAMELPVVASHEVGLPEVVRPDWGRLVPPGDAAALASAISELLGLSAERRASMGEAGRAFVREHRDLRRQAMGLLELIDAAR